MVSIIWLVSLLVYIRYLSVCCLARITTEHRLFSSFERFQLKTVLSIFWPILHWVFSTIWTIHVWFTQNTCLSLNRTWRGNKLLLKGLFLWAWLARLAGLIRLTKFFLRWKPTIQKVVVSGHTPAASTAPKLRIYLAIPLLHIIHSTLLSVNGNKNSVLKMY